MLTTDPWPTTLDEFVAYIATLWARQVADTNIAAWCPEWWRHPEVEFRMDAMWQAGTLLREGGPLWASVWLRDHVDAHMRRLTDPDGPLKFCSERIGHKDLPALPVRPRPAATLAVVA